MKKKIIIKVIVEIFKKICQDKDKLEKKLWIMEFITAHLLFEKNENEKLSLMT